MPEPFGLTASTPSPQTCTLAEASADDPLLQQLATVNNVHAKLADGLSGTLGLYDVQIDGQSKLMTRQELESLNTCFASASNAPTARASAPSPAALSPAGATVSFSNAAPNPIAAPTATTAKATTAPAAQATAPATPAPVDPKQRAVEVVRDILATVEEVHTYDYARLGLSGMSRERFIADQLVALGERASGRTSCSAKVDPDDRRKMFDLGAAIMADRLGMGKAFGAAARAGDARAQQMDDRQVRAWSDGSQSTRPQREAYLQRVEVERTLKTLSNIEGGLGGAIGAAVGGHEGSDMGAAFDGVASAFGGTYQARDTVRTTTASDNRPRIESTNRGSAPEKSDPQQNQPGSTKPDTVNAPKTNEGRYWQQTKPTSSNPMDGRSVGTRGVTDISTARKAGSSGGPDGSGGPKPAGGASNDNAALEADQHQMQQPKRMAVGDNRAGGTNDDRAIKATVKPPGGGDSKKLPAEPSILRDPPPGPAKDAGATKPAGAGTTPTSGAAATGAAASAGAPDAAAAQGTKKPLWTADSLMRGSPYKASQPVLYRGAVERMAKEMANKTFDWSNPTDPIIVNKQGVILQGHHRIAAARLAGVQIPPDAIKVVDIREGRDPRPWQSVTVREGERPQQR